MAEVEPNIALTVAGKITMAAVEPAVANIALTKIGLGRVVETGDIPLACKKCGTGFIFSVSDQELFRAKGLENPARCGPCHEKRKGQKKDDYKDRRKARRVEKSVEAACATAPSSTPPRTSGKGGVPLGTCYNCGEPGHLSLDCPQPRSGGRALQGDGACYRCGGIGHKSFDCPLPDTRGAAGTGSGRKGSGGKGDSGNGSGGKCGSSKGGNGVSTSPRKDIVPLRFFRGSAGASGTKSDMLARAGRAGTWSRVPPRAGLPGPSFWFE